MSCMDDFGSHANGPGWFPVDIDPERRPFLTENTFYYKNETRFFDPSRSGISGLFDSLKKSMLDCPSIPFGGVYLEKEEKLVLLK